MREDFDDSKMQPTEQESSSSVDSVISSASARHDISRAEWLEMKQAQPLDFGQILAQLNRSVPASNSAIARGRAPRAQPEDARIGEYDVPVRHQGTDDYPSKPPPIPPRRESAMHSKKDHKPRGYNHQYDHVGGPSTSTSMIASNPHSHRHNKLPMHYRSAENIYDEPQIVRKNERSNRMHEEGIRLVGRNMTPPKSRILDFPEMQRSYSSIVYKPNEGACAIDSASFSRQQQQHHQPGMSLVSPPAKPSQSGEIPITRIVTAHVTETEPVKMAKIQKIPRYDSSFYKGETKSHDYVSKSMNSSINQKTFKTEKPPNPIVRELEEFLKSDNSKSNPTEENSNKGKAEARDNKSEKITSEASNSEPIYEKPRGAKRPPKLEKRASSCDESNLEKFRQEEVVSPQEPLRESSSQQDVNMNTFEAIYNRLQRLRGRGDSKHEKHNKEQHKEHKNESKDKQKNVMSKQLSLDVEKADKEAPPKPPRSPTIGQLLLQTYVPKKVSSSSSSSGNNPLQVPTPLNKSSAQQVSPQSPGSAAPTIVAPQFRVFRHSLSTPDMLQGITIPEQNIDPAQSYPPNQVVNELKQSKEERLKEGTEALGRLLKRDNVKRASDRASSSASVASAESTTSSEHSRESSQSKVTLVSKRSKSSTGYPKITAVVPMLPELPEDRELSAGRLQEDREIGISLRLVRE